MSDERRFADDEIAGILERAASAEQSSRSAPLGRASTDADGFRLRMGKFDFHLTGH